MADPIAQLAPPVGPHAPQAAVASVQATDPLRFIMRWNSIRLRYYTSLKTWPTFGKGWANRIANNLMKGAS